MNPDQKLDMTCSNLGIFQKEKCLNYFYNYIKFLLLGGNPTPRLQWLIEYQSIDYG